MVVKRRKRKRKKGMETKGKIRVRDEKKTRETRIEKWFLRKTKAVVNENKTIAARPCRNNRK